MIIVKRPDGNNSAASYLYNVILRNKDWEKVTLMVEEDEQMLERLNKHGITFFKMNGSLQITRQVSSNEDVIKGLVSALNFFDSILNTLLTDDQMAKLMEREGELTEVVKVKEKAEALLKNE